MPRTSEPVVRTIIDTDLPSPEIDLMISDVSLWIDEELATLDPAPSAGRLEIIERWLTAAMIRVKDLGLATGAIEDVSEKYQVDPEVTDYLLRAASFDTTGTVRRHFLAPKPVAEPTAPTYQAIARVADGFVGDV